MPKHSLIVFLSFASLLLFGCGNGSNAGLAVGPLNLAPNATTTFVGRSVHLIATLSDGTHPPVSWSSSSPQLTVTNGDAKCLGGGNYEARAEIIGIVASAQIVCEPPTLASVTFTSTPAIVRSENSYQYGLLGTYTDGTIHDLTSTASWAADSPVSAISSSGLLSCNHSGVTTVTARFGGLSATTSPTCVLKTITPAPGFADTAARFDGPFKSWVNVQTVFGAKGDGVTDDTAAIQNALTSQLQNPSVLWLPHGKYLISQPLNITGAANFSIVGEDPRTTSIIWGGAAGATMLTLDGCSGFKLSRLTWDGANTAANALAVIWDRLPGQLYPTRDLIADSSIMNVGIGIQVGFAGETTIQRVHFSRNTVAGISLGDWDALDFNVLDSLFTDCGYGITNTLGQGAFNVYNSVFVRSTVSDLGIGNTGPFSFRSNISYDSSRFLWELGNGGAANTVIEGNTIVGAANDPITVRNPGPILLIDNQFLQLDSELHIFNFAAAVPLALISVGNTFAVQNPYEGMITSHTSLSEVSYPFDIATPPGIPSETYVPPLSGRPVYEVAAGASAQIIQAAIDSATAAGGGVIHLPAGYYPITKTIQVSSSADVAIIGDGIATNLVADSQLSDPLIYADGSAVELEEFLLSGNALLANSIALKVSIPDKPSTHVVCDVCTTGIANVSGIDVLGVDEAAIEFRVAVVGTDLRASALMPNSPAEGFRIHGGLARQSGQAVLGRVNLFMTTADDYSIDSGGQLFVTDGWHDSGQGPRAFAVTGMGELTQQGGAIFGGALAPSMLENQFAGSVNILGVATDSLLSIGTSSTGTTVVLGSTQNWGQQVVVSNSDMAVVAEVGNAMQVGGGVEQLVPDIAGSAQIIEDAFAMSRTQYVLPRRKVKDGTTSIRMTRLEVLPSATGIQISPKTTNPGEPRFSIAAVDGSGAGASCSAGEFSMAGTWSLVKSGDGFVGLASGGNFLFEEIGPVANGYAIGTSQVLNSALGRWIAQDNGDGSVTIVNRATGHVLVQDGSGCAYAGQRNASSSQDWLIDLAQ